MEAKIKYEFHGKMWLHSIGGWYFMTLPHDFSQEIRLNLKNEETGWGRLKAKVQIQNSIWSTSIWFDTKLNSYLLPIKAEIRKKENLVIGNDYKVLIWV
jgi:hypothetical protein